MKLLIITYRIPYPLTEGGKISQFALIDYLRNKCAITLLVFADTAADQASIQYLRNIWDNVTFEVIAINKPTPVIHQPFYKHFADFFRKVF